MCETLKLELCDLFETKGRIREEELSYGADEVALFGRAYAVKECSPIFLRLETEEPERVHVTGSLALTLGASCDRCLKEVPVPLSLTFDRLLYADGEQREEIDSEGFFAGTELSVDALIKEELLLAMPQKILCREDCKGLCPICGADRNEGECGCDPFVPDPRMAAIQDIFNQANKEV